MATATGISQWRKFWLLSWLIVQLIFVLLLFYLLKVVVWVAITIVWLMPNWMAQRLYNWMEARGCFDDKNVPV